MNKQQITEAGKSLLEAVITSKANLQGEFGDLIAALWLANGSQGLTVPTNEGYSVGIFGLENFDLSVPAQRNKYFSTIGRNAKVSFDYEKDAEGTVGFLKVNGQVVITKKGKRLLDLISLNSVADAYPVWLKQTGENIGGSAEAGQRGRLPEKDIMALHAMGLDYAAIAGEVDRDANLVRDFLVKKGVKV